MNDPLFSRPEDKKKVALDSGATLLTQVVPDALSVSVGLWIKSGSRDESPVLHGVSHFLEHMVFKGTRRRSALDIALALDRLGGQLDAFTTKEITCFDARVLAQHFDIAFDVLCDMVSEPLLDPEMIETEKQVVISEINNVFDDPDDLIHELAGEELFASHPLGRPILGTEQSVTRFQRAELAAFVEQRFNAANVIIAIAGPLGHDELEERVEAHFRLRRGPAYARPSPALPPVAKGIRIENRDLQQQHLWIGRQGIATRHPDRYKLWLLVTLLGGSTSSRLFQSIREQAGLAYSVFSFCDFASDAGLVGTYMAVAPARTEEAIRRTLDEFVRLISKGCPPAELEDTKMQLKGSLLLAMESVAARMSRLARNELSEGRFVAVSELVERIDAVTVADIQRMAAEFLNPDALTLVSLGPNPGKGPF